MTFRNLYDQLFVKIHCTFPFIGQFNSTNFFNYRSKSVSFWNDLNFFSNFRVFFSTGKVKICQKCWSLISIDIYVIEQVNKTQPIALNWSLNHQEIKAPIGRGKILDIWPSFWGPQNYMFIIPTGEWDPVVRGLTGEKGGTLTLICGQVRCQMSLTCSTGCSHNSLSTPTLSLAAGLSIFFT